MSRTASSFLLVLTFGCALAAQDPVVPVANVLSFRLTITGSGNDPDPSDAVAAAYQVWYFDRVIEGYYEVEVATAGNAKTGQRLVYKPRRGGRSSITGQRIDSAENRYSELGEGSNLTGVSPYTAFEEWRRDGPLSPPPRDLVVTLDPSRAEWTTMFLPVGWFGELETGDVHYTGGARFDPPTGSALGEPWTFLSQDPNERSKGNKRIETRYSPARRFFLPFPLKLRGAVVPATFEEDEEVGGHVVRGSLPFEVDQPRDAPGKFKMTGKLDWVVRARLPEVELKVRIPEYETWRPSAGEGTGVAGSELEVIAELRRADGDKNGALPQIKTLTWLLIGTSSEPGISMNYPYASDDKSPDLTLAPAGDGVASAEGQELVVNAPPGRTSRIHVVPWDWGGFGTLRVKAELMDGRKLQGVLEGGPPIIGPVRDVPVPARIPGSNVAMGWLRAQGVRWKDDAEDDDARPSGKPGTQGDGFTLYEEYRGVHWGSAGARAHVSLDPRQKDLFVRIAPAAVPFASHAVESFSGLSVHWTSREDQLPRAEANQRIVNVNIGKGATNGPQTALWVSDKISRTRINDSIPAGARPATVPRIDLPADDAVAPLVRDGGVVGVDPGVVARAEVAKKHQLAQAILQACGVERPGASDRFQILSFVPPNPLRGEPPHFLLGGLPILIDVQGHDYAAALLDKLGHLPIVDEWVLVGEAGGAHSGPEECVMRDWFARLYRTAETRGRFPVYGIAPQQRPGTRLATTRAGTGINAPGRSGGPVFGASRVVEAAAYQVVVKDSAR